MKKTIFLALAHFLTDFITIFALFSRLGSTSFSLEQCLQIIFIYNAVAFALQLPVGILADKIQNTRFILLVSTGLMTVGLFFFPVSVYPMVILMALGHAFFHIGGGIETLQINPAKSKYLGLFIGPGAIGLTLGTLLGKSALFHPFFLFILIGLLTVCFLLMPLITKIIQFVNFTQFATTGNKLKSENPKFQLKVTFPVLFLILIFGAIFFMVLIGLASKYNYQTGIFSIMLITAAAFLGKSLGGFIADRFGWDKTVLLALVFSAFLIAFKSGNIFIYAAGLLFFQMIIPITLVGLNGILKNRSGLALGLNYLAYFLGVQMYDTILIYKMRNPLTLLLSIISVAVVLFLIFRNMQIKNQEKFKQSH